MIIMNKTINNRVRYYRLELQKTLFDEYLVYFIYGAVNNKSPTRIIKSFYQSKQEAVVVINQKVKEKLQRGYTIKEQGNGNKYTY